MKKLGYIFLIFTLLILNLQWTSSTASAATNEKDFTTKANSTGVTITGYKGKAKDVIIPKTINGQPVTRIGDEAFSNKGLKSVRIPEGVTIIGDEAFSINSLTSIDIPKSVTKIGEHAFLLNKLKSVTIPNNVKEVGEAAFAMNELKKVTLSNNMKNIKEATFSYNKITSVVIPKSVTKIEDLAFSINDIKSVTFSEGLKTIGESAFSLNKITSIDIPKSVTEIEKGAFSFNALKKVTFKGAISKKIAKDTFDFQDPVYTFLGWYTDKAHKTKWNYWVKSPMTIYAKWGEQAPALAAKNVTITNNIENDTIQLKGLKKGYTYTIYKDENLKKKLTSFTATGSTKTVNVKQIGAKKGSVYIVVNKSGFLPSLATKVNFKAEPTKALSSKNVTVKNTKKEDTIKLTGLKKGTTYTIYKDAKKKLKLASFTAKSTTEIIVVNQLGTNAGEIYIAAKAPGYEVSALTKVSYSEEK